MKELIRYTKAADKARLAGNAMARTVKTPIGIASWMKKHD
jgi:hypothetical protein